MVKKPKLKPKIFLENGRFVARDELSIQNLRQSHYGVFENGNLILNPVEVLHLVNIRKIPCISEEGVFDFEKIFRNFSSEQRLFVRYNVFRDWRERGLFLQLPNQIELEHFGNSPTVKYPSKSVDFPKFETTLYFYPDDMVSFVYDYPAARVLFEEFWFGQLGVYKQHTRDKVLKLDIIETLFLARIGYKVKNLKTGRDMDFNSILNFSKKRDTRIPSLFDVYEDWRMRGYILKTGFKFGAHFRVYFPGASPIRSKSKWLHSKHVLHLFPKTVKLKMSEWARAVRVAHGVRKTFIMAIPEMEGGDYQEDARFDFIGYRRKKNDVERPGKDNPKFLILALSEDDELGGREMASALALADELGLSLIIAISDRETSVTYYLAKLIDIPGSRNRYYEIEWFQP